MSHFIYPGAKQSKSHKAMEQLKTTHCEFFAHFDALFASLQHRAFRGEL